MKVVVLKLDYHDDKARKKIMKTVSGHSGVVSISLDPKEMKLTVTGDIDPVSLVSKLRKLCNADIVSVGAPKAPEPKKEEPKKDELAKIMQAFEAYQKSTQYPTVTPHYYYNNSNPYFVKPIEEDPNACVIS